MKFEEIGNSKGRVKCPFPDCDTNIIPYNEELLSSVVEIDKGPQMVNIDESEKSLKYFRIKDMWDFDNIGVSRPMQETSDFHIDDKTFDIERLLICSECDKGPIGFAGHFSDETKQPNNMTYFLSCESVNYQN